VDVVQSLLLLGSTSGESTFGFTEGFSQVFCLTRDPVLPELRDLAEESRTLTLVHIDLADAASVTAAAKALPNSVDLLINNGNIPKAMLNKLLTG